MGSEVDDLLRRREGIRRQRPTLMVFMALGYFACILFFGERGTDHLMLVFACAAAVCYVEYRRVKAAKVSIELAEKLQDMEERLQIIEQRGG